MTLASQSVNLARRLQPNMDIPMDARQPNRLLLPLLTLVVGFSLGTLLPGFAEEAAGEPAEPPLAYVLVGGRAVEGADLAAYGEAAGPLAQAAGINVVARASTEDAQVMEGAWPYEGFITIETFRSMDEFTAFWTSPGYQEAIKLREGKVDLDFVVAIEGIPAAN